MFHLVNYAFKFGNRNASYSLVKLHYFQFVLLENCVHKKQKKSTKDQRNFCSNTFFKVFANSLRVFILRYDVCAFLMSRMIIFFITLVGDLPEIEECLYLTTTMEQFIPNINFVFSLNIKVSKIYGN